MRNLLVPIKQSASCSLLASSPDPLILSKLPPDLSDQLHVRWTEGIPKRVGQQTAVRSASDTGAFGILSHPP
jgi:hypothetical protein